MPTQYAIFPFLLPFKMVPNTLSPGIHFDDKWACEQIRDFQIKAYYKQKWQKSETTPLQLESSITPDNLKLLDVDGNVVKEFVWTPVVLGVGYKTYQTIYDVTDVPDAYYWLYQRVQLLTIDWGWVSEPIDVRIKHPNTVRIDFENSYNDNGIAWTATGLTMSFRFEGGIPADTANFKRNNTGYTNQENRYRVLKGRAYREIDLLVGDAPGVAPWVGDLLNRIFTCDYTSIENKRYVAPEEIEIKRNLGYPLIGAKQTLLEWDNALGSQFNNAFEEIAPGIVTAYNIETGFFGPGALVPITEIIENG